MKKLIVRCHGIGPLVDLCDGVDSDGRGAEAAARCFWNLAVDDDNKVQIAASGAVPALVAVLSSKGEERRGAREAAAGALRNLAVRPENRALIIEGGACSTARGAPEVGRRRGLGSRRAVRLEPRLREPREPGCFIIVHRAARGAVRRGRGGGAGAPPARCGICCMRTPVTATPPPRRARRRSSRSS